LNISVTMAVFNAEKTLRRAIDSILGQIEPVAEIILIDDGSTDKTAQIAESYGEAVRYFHYDNAGLAVARNRGIAQAKSEWIAFLDADDEWLPNFTDSHIHIINRNPNIKWSYCHQERILMNGRVGSYIPSYVKDEMEREGSVSYFRAVLAGFYFGTCGFIIHRSVFDELGGFNPVMHNGMDGDMWRRIALYYPQVVICENVCWRYYCDNQNALHRKGRWCRDLQMKSICDNMRRAMELGAIVVDEYRPYGKMLIMWDLMREASRDCSIRADIKNDAISLFALTTRDHWILRLLKYLPKSIAIRVMDMFLLFSQKKRQKCFAGSTIIKDVNKIR